MIILEKLVWSIDLVDAIYSRRVPIPVAVFTFDNS